VNSFSNLNDKDHRFLSPEKSLASSNSALKDDDVLLLAEEENVLVLAEEDVVSAEECYMPEEPSPFVNQTTAKTWKILIADDEKAVHEVTQLALQGFTFHGKPLTFLSAYSGEEAKAILAQHSDIALIFLDVVMETNYSGLEVIKYIRETLKNKLIRIILRTGQPGEAPEESIIVNYDINDYKLKTELTQRRLFTTLVAGLRGYYDLMILEANKRFSKQVLESIPVGVTVYNADGSMHYANKQAIHLLGKNVVPGTHTDDLTEVYQLYLAGTQLLYPHDRLPMILAFQGQTVRTDDLEIHQPTGIIPVEIWSTPIYDDHNQITQAIVAFQDITERKQGEQNKIRLAQAQEAKNVALRYTHEIEAKNAELVKLNQEKSEFLGIAAHDLKNPLSAILGLAEMIADNVDNLPKEEILDYANGIRLSAKQMFDLIINLLDVNRLESGKFNISWQPTDLSSLVQQLLAGYQERAVTKQIQLHYQGPTLPCVAQLDPNVTRQILDNLISNAIKYSPLGKSVYVRLLQTEHHTVRCEIQDEGPGLSEIDHQKLFGKFTRLTAQPTGGEHSTGLGLFIVKKLVTALKGQVWCESELGKGATFIVEFVQE
jgi:signal transduction histidine kinase